MNKVSSRSVAQYGFTIVELLIVVVVIAILAAITIVSYNGITSQANDSARDSDANTILKKAELRYVETGLYGYGATEPTSRANVLDTYGLQALSDRLAICGYDDPCESEDPSDKSKIYMMQFDDGFILRYWSNSSNNWEGFERFEYSDGTVVDM